MPRAWVRHVHIRVHLTGRRVREQIRHVRGVPHDPREGSLAQVPVAGGELHLRKGVLVIVDRVVTRHPQRARRRVVGDREAPEVLRERERISGVALRQSKLHRHSIHIGHVGEEGNLGQQGECRQAVQGIKCHQPDRRAHGGGLERGAQEPCGHVGEPGVSRLTDGAEVLRAVERPPRRVEVRRRAAFGAVQREAGERLAQIPVPVSRDIVQLAVTVHAAAVALLRQVRVPILDAHEGGDLVVDVAELDGVHSLQPAELPRAPVGDPGGLPGELRLECVPVVVLVRGRVHAHVLAVARGPHDEAEGDIRARGVHHRVARAEDLGTEIAQNGLTAKHQPTTALVDDHRDVLVREVE